MLNLRKSLFGSHRLVVMAATVGLASLTLSSACSSSKGSDAEFGEAKNEQPGVHVKPADTPAEDALPDFRTALQVKPTYDAKAGTLNVDLDVAEGFHAYAVGEQTGVPVALTVANVNGWKMEGKVSTPPGKEKEVAGEKSLILEGKIPVSAKVTGGKGDIKGSVRVQICTNKSCDKPRNHDFQIAPGA